MQFKDQHYVVSIDYLSKWPQLAKLDNLSCGNVISRLKSQFSRYRIVDDVITDNGPQFSSRDFLQFAKEYGLEHTTTSPHYPQAIGQIEGTVQASKNLLKKAKDPHLALLDYRNSSIQDIGMSQCFFNAMPIALSLLKPIGSEEIRKQLKQRRKKQKFYFDKHASKQQLNELQKRQSVIFRNIREMSSRNSK